MAGNSRHLRLVAWLFATTTVCGLSNAGFAQTSASNSSPAAVNAIADVVVTARHRTENIQNVPIAVTAISGAFLSQRVATDTTALERYTPNVTLSENNYTSGGLNASIRGVSFADLERSFEPAVGLAVDGAFLASNSGAIIDLFDVDAVEVLRGPQGTLFGRNTIGGVISINHAKPTGAWGASADAIFGSYGRNDYKVMLNAPVVDGVLAAKLVLYDLNSDSFTHNIVTGKTDPGQDRKALSASLLYTPTSHFSAWATYEYIDDRSSSTKAVNLTAPNQLFCAAFGACITNGGDVAARNGYKVSFTASPFDAPFTSDNFNIRLHYTAGSFDFDSVTDYLETKDHLNEENSGAADFNFPGAPGPLPLLYINRTTQSNQFSQELRVSSHLQGPINFVSGLYYFNSFYNLDPQDVYVLGGLSQSFKSEQRDKSYAVFTEVYINLPLDSRLTLGGRYTYETKDFATTAFNVPPATGIIYTCPDPNAAYQPCRDPTVNFSNFTPRITLDHHFTPDLMIYGTYAQGFRSGGWDGRAQSQDSIGPYKPEEVNSYEAGLRGQWFEHRLTTNVSVFDMEYKNKQEEVLTPSPLNPLVSETTVQNAASATSRGVEFEAQAAPTQALRLYTAMGYLDASYDKFLVADVDVKDTRNYRYAPKWTFSLGSDYTLPVPAWSGKFIGSANYKWTDKFTTSPDRDTTGLNRDVIKEYGKLDLSLTWSGQGGPFGSGYKVSVFGNDVTHADGRLIGTLDAGSFWFGIVGPGRTLGVELRADF